MKRLLTALVLPCLAACGPTAEDYAGAFVGDQVTHTTFGESTSTSAEAALLSIRAIDEQTLRIDDLYCPLDFKAAEDKELVFELVPRICERENTRTEHDTGTLTFSEGSETVVLATAGKSTTGSIISINTTFTTSFTGTKQP